MILKKFFCTGISLALIFSSFEKMASFNRIYSDSAVNVVDMIYLKRFILKNPEDYEEKYDFNKDKKTDVSDLVWLKEYLLGVRSSLYPEDIDESAVLEPKGTVHTGEATFYGGGYTGGCAMLDPVSEEYWITAMNLEDYADARLAGAYLEVTGELGTINVLVTDLLPEGKKGDLDLYVDAFPLIAPVEKGRVPVSWRIIPLDSAENAPVKYRFKEGSSPYWCGVQLLNHRYPIAKLEYMNDKGEFVEIKRRPYNYFESMEMGAGPFTFRATDIYGQVIVDYDIPLVLDEIIDGESQFPI